MKQILNVFLLLALAGCSGLEKSEKEKLKENNAKGEYVYRHHDETLYAIPPARQREREPYPWEMKSEKKVVKK